jgi:hypothetical protein
MQFEAILPGICAPRFPRSRDLSVSANANDGAEALQQARVAFMFLIRATFWVGLAILLLPSDERQQERLYAAAAATFERAATFCERNPKVCETGGELWATFLKKAEFGVRMAVNAASSGGPTAEGAGPLPPAPARYEPRPRMSPTAAQGTLTPADLAPAWRGQMARTGT